MPKLVEMGGLRIDEGLYALVRDEIAPGTGVRSRCVLGELGSDCS